MEKQTGREIWYDLVPVRGARLLVSVRDAEEARAALAGGAHIIDAKEPSAGALGSVSVETLRRIVHTVAGERAVTAALGDADDDALVERRARAFVAGGAHLVKLGLAGCDAVRAAAMIHAAARGAGAGRVVAVAYADHRQVASPSPEDVLRLADAAGIAGVLIDTALKDGPGLPDLMAPGDIASWVSAARRGGLLAALAGKVAQDDIADLAAAGADVIGVRGAACDGGRSGRISTDRVRGLAATVRSAVRPTAVGADLQVGPYPSGRT